MTILILTAWIFLLGPLFKDFAQITIGERGGQMLICPKGYKYHFHRVSNNGITTWRCFATLSKPGTKRHRCQVCIYTKKINGYEMIKSVKHHGHEPVNFWTKFYWDKKSLKKQTLEINPWQTEWKTESSVF